MYNENPNNYNGYDPYVQNRYVTEQQVTDMVTGTMKKVYVRMFIALLITAAVSYFCAASEAFKTWALAHSWFMIGVIIAEFALVIGLSGALNRISSTMAVVMLYVFAGLNGLMLFSIFLAYQPYVIAKTFLITAGTFGAMSVYGYTTSNDLSKIGSYLIMALFGLIIASLVNMFFRSGTFDWIISIAGVAIFIGLTAWDTQAVKRMAAVTPADQSSRLATIGALNLYLDFINLFLYLLRIFGNRR